MQPCTWRMRGQPTVVLIGQNAIVVLGTCGTPDPGPVSSREGDQVLTAPWLHQAAQQRLADKSKRCAKVDLVSAKANLLVVEPTLCQILVNQLQLSKYLVKQTEVHHQQSKCAIELGG